MASVTPFNPTTLPHKAYEFQPRKPRLSLPGLKALLLFLWKYDLYDYEHPRYRLQTALSLHLIVYLGLQPLAGLVEGLFYGDTKLLVAYQNGKRRIVLVIRLNARDKHQAKLWEG